MSTSGPDPVTSTRVRAAHTRAEQRRARQRGRLRPLGWAVIAVVAIPALTARPGPGTHGLDLDVAVALGVFVTAMALITTPGWANLGQGRQLAVVLVLGGSGVALAGLQPNGSSGLAASAAVWVAGARFPLRLAIAVGSSITLALALVVASAGHGSAQGVLATVLLCALLGVMAQFMRQAWANQDRTELLLAQLEDARDEQTRSAALAERGRIAEELHDVLAHSLSGLAIQLEVARKQAGQEDASSSLKQTIDTAGQLTRAGLGDARRAVNALRGEELPKLGQLASLLDTYRRDLHVDVSLTVEGEIRPLPAETEFALYRGVQEALTNVARHAPGAATAVTLRYSPDCATVTITDRARAEEEIPAPATATSFGGGNGLTGMRERMTRVGGAMTAGPTPTGWTVVLETPV